MRYDYSQDRANELLEEAVEQIKTLYNLLKEADQWITNWEPDFIYDDEWEEFDSRMQKALSEGYTDDTDS